MLSIQRCYGNSVLVWVVRVVKWSCEHTDEPDTLHATTGLAAARTAGSVAPRTLRCEEDLVIVARQQRVAGTLRREGTYSREEVVSPV